LPGCDAGNGGSIPPDVLVTAQRPDLVVINRTLNTVIILELTCPWDSNTDRMHKFKMDKYAALVRDLSLNFKTELYCVEVSVRGQLSKSNRSRLKSFLLKTTGLSRSYCINLLNSVSKAALLSSFSIFTAREDVVWNISTNLSVNMKT
jgi:hypothetical protein